MTSELPTKAMGIEPSKRKPSIFRSVYPIIKKLNPPRNETGIACMVSVAIRGLGCMRNGYKVRRNTAPRAPAPIDVIVIKVPRIPPEKTVKGDWNFLKEEGVAIRRLV